MSERAYSVRAVPDLDPADADAATRAVLLRYQRHDLDADQTRDVLEMLGLIAPQAGPDGRLPSARREARRRARKARRERARSDQQEAS